MLVSACHEGNLLSSEKSFIPPLSDWVAIQLLLLWFIFEFSCCLISD